MTGNVIVSKAVTPDGTVLHSRHRHDCVVYEDSEGVKYLLDGGNDYTRTSGNFSEYITITDDMEIKEIREHFDWGTYGKDGTEDLHYILLKDMETDHIKAVMGLGYISDDTRTLFVRELAFRGEL